MAPASPLRQEADLLPLLKASVRSLVFGTVVPKRTRSTQAVPVNDLVQNLLLSGATQCERGHQRRFYSPPFPEAKSRPGVCPSSCVRNFVQFRPSQTPIRVRNRRGRATGALMNDSRRRGTRRRSAGATDAPAGVHDEATDINVQLPAGPPRLTSGAARTLLEVLLRAHQERSVAPERATTSVLDRCEVSR